MTIGIYQHATEIMEDQIIAALERFYEQPSSEDKAPIVGQVGGQSPLALADLDDQVTQTHTG